MKKLHKLMSNLRYVSIDREAARNHWWTLVEMSQLAPDVYAVNRQMIVENKATAGILSHQQTRGFILHRMKERSLLRKISVSRSIYVELT